MSETRSLLRETIAKCQENVRTREQELLNFRKLADAYISYLEAEIRDNREIIAFSEKQLSKSTRLVDVPAIPNFLGGGSRETVSATKTRLRDGQPPANQSELIRAATREILAAERRPLKQAEIKHLMDERGLVISSGDPVDLIRAALRRAPEFQHLPRIGYVLREHAQEYLDK